jgi:hypothetical protein
MFILQQNKHTIHELNQKTFENTQINFGLSSTLGSRLRREMEIARQGKRAGVLEVGRAPAGASSSELRRAGRVGSGLGRPARPRHAEARGRRRPGVARPLLLGAGASRPRARVRAVQGARGRWVQGVVGLGNFLAARA